MRTQLRETAAGYSFYLPSFAGHPKLARAAIRANLETPRPPGNGRGNRARRRAGLRVAERVFPGGWSHTGMTVGEVARMFRK